MKILICIKQVPDMESKFKINGEGNWYDRADLAWRMNEYDEYAVEQAVRLKEQVKDADLTVLCVGAGSGDRNHEKGLAMAVIVECTSRTPTPTSASLWRSLP